MTSIVQLKAVSHAYDGHLVLSHACLALGEGEIVGLIGPSGSGKSTVLRLAAGIERPQRGEIRHRGTAVWQGSSSSVRGGFVLPIFQNPQSSLDPAWPIWRSITEPLWRERLSRRQRFAIAEQLLDKAGLNGVDIGALPSELSGGQCQRVAILRAIAGKPSLIIADEPTSALDSASGLLVRKLLQEAASKGVAILVASHDEKELASLAHRQCRIVDSCLVERRSSPQSRTDETVVDNILARRQQIRSRVTSAHVPAIHTP
jgi:peptide/nickel transport system ATP-binding protein